VCLSVPWDLAIRRELCYIKTTRIASQVFRVIYFLLEESMFDVTQKATEMIKEALKEQEKNSPIRVIYNEGG